MSVKKKSGNGRCKIVIVEDSPTQAEQLKYILETHGYQVVSATNGKEALELVRSDKPDIVMSDIVMPEMDGYELCRQIKTDEKLKDIPVIILTALSDPADVIKGLECGADNFLTKPYDERVLFSRIEYLRLNWRLPETQEVRMGVEITFSGQKYFITSDRLQILNLLLSTYEAAVSKNMELVQAQGELRKLNEQLEQRVKARTAELEKANEELKLEITERKQAEQEQERLSQQLQAQVSELEAFSYGIAHDLRSPLVSIEGFSRLLREDLKSQKMESVAEDIRLLESGVRKMQGFLNSTLEYSRSGHLITRTNDVSFSEIVTEVITELNGQISAIGATVSLAQTSPNICVDRSRIKQVLTNLIQNSIKYRDKTVPLKIEIGHYLEEKETVLFVRDNGTGIDASEAEKVFALFYRGTSEGEGSGIGLAIVKKIIEAHGGKIWVQEGQPGKGTTMCFTLPEPSDIKKEHNNGKD